MGLCTGFIGVSRAFTKLGLAFWGSIVVYFFCIPPMHGNYQAILPRFCLIGPLRDPGISRRDLETVSGRHD